VLPANEPVFRARPKREIKAFALLGAVVLALAGVGSIWLGATASETIQDVWQAVRFAPPSGIEGEQQRQAAAIAELSRTVQAIAASVDTMATRSKASDHYDVAMSDRFALIDTDIAAVTAELKSLRAAAIDPAAVADLRLRTERLEATAAETRRDFDVLRTSLDAYARIQGGDFAVITHRLDRLEQMGARELTGSIRTPARKKQVRRKPRAIKAAQPRRGMPPFSQGIASGPMFPAQVRLDRNVIATPR
jgi:hypothetical protein